MNWPVLKKEMFALKNEQGLIGRRFLPKRKDCCMLRKILGLGIILFLTVNTAGADGFLLASQRDHLAERGWTFDFHSIADYVHIANSSNGDKSSWLGRFDVVLDLDTGKAGYYEGGTLHIDIMNAGGGRKPTGDVLGDLQGFNNIEAVRTTRIFEAWYEQQFLSEALSVKAGLHDLNAEFAASDNGALYLNSSFGIIPVISGNTGVSIYPLTSLGVRMKITPNESFSLFAGVYDGDPGDADTNKHNTHASVTRRGGLFSIIEGQYQYKIPAAEALSGTFKMGAWHNSGDVDDVAALDADGNAIVHDDNFGGYMIVDQKVFHETDEQGLSVFFMGGLAPKDRDVIERSLVAGLNYTGLLPSRDQDVMGVALAQASISDKLRPSSGQSHAETALEWTYQVQVNDNVVIQPDFQYVINPNADDAAKNARVFMLRTDISF
jgi:porin